MTHIGSLPPAVETLLYQVIGCALAVHRELGPGFLESVYRKAMVIELTARGVPFECERPISVCYRGHDIPGQRVDLVAGGLVVVELKSVAAIEPVHLSQVISYLKTMRLRAGLIVNFHESLLKNGIRRVVL